MQSKKVVKAMAFVLVIAFLLLSLVYKAHKIQALPIGPTLTYQGNETINSTPASRTDKPGYIHFLNFSALQQNNRWKAYVGNVTGQLTLDDSSGNTIYDWTLTSITGEVYASRASSITWSNINCSNHTSISLEETALGMSSSDDDSINKTFNETNHYTMVTAGRTMHSGNCRAQFTYVNDAPQTTNFEELLLSDGANFVYATFINESSTGFDGNIEDFQMIVADMETNPQTYYFWVELG